MAIVLENQQHARRVDQNNECIGNSEPTCFSKIQIAKKENNDDNATHSEEDRDSRSPVLIDRHDVNIISYQATGFWYLISQSLRQA